MIKKQENHEQEIKIFLPSSDEVKKAFGAE